MLGVLHEFALTGILGQSHLIILMHEGETLRNFFAALLVYSVVFMSGYVLNDLEFLFVWSYVMAF